MGHKMKKFVVYYIVISLITPSVYAQDYKGVKDAKDVKEVKEPKEVKESKEIKEPKESKKESVVIPAKEKQEDILKGLDYPELQVVPRASDRLLMETQNEREYGWIAFWPYQVSSVMTLLAGNRLRGNYKDDTLTEIQKKDSDNIALSAMALGVGGLGLSIFLIRMDLYGDGFKRVKSVKVTDKRSELLRERLSEESLEKPAHLINMLTTVSVASNLLANLAVISQANADVRNYAAIGVVASFLPWMFSNRYVDNWQKQEEYKRKIYTPLIGYDWQFVPQNKSFQPQLTMNWQF